MRFISSKEQIRNVDDLKPIPVPVPEWAESGDDPAEMFVLVRGLTGEERDALDGHLWNIRKGKPELNWEEYLRNLRARWVARTVVDENRDRIFADEDFEWLGRKNAASLDRIADAARKLSGATKEEEEEVGKDSAPVHSIVSLSDSRSRLASQEGREQSSAY